MNVLQFDVITVADVAAKGARLDRCYGVLLQAEGQPVGARVVDGQRVLGNNCDLIEAQFQLLEFGQRLDGVGDFRQLVLVQPDLRQRVGRGAGQGFEEFGRRGVVELVEIQVEDSQGRQGHGVRGQRFEPSRVGDVQVGESRRLAGQAFEAFKILGILDDQRHHVIEARHEGQVGLLAQIAAVDKDPCITNNN